MLIAIPCIAALWHSQYTSTRAWQQAHIAEGKDYWKQQYHPVVPLRPGSSAKWDGEGLWDVPGSSLNGDKNLPIKKTISSGCSNNSDQKCLLTSKNKKQIPTKYILAHQFSLKFKWMRYNKHCILLTSLRIGGKTYSCFLDHQYTFARTF